MGDMKGLKLGSGGDWVLTLLTSSGAVIDEIQG